MTFRSSQMPAASKRRPRTIPAFSVWEPRSTSSCAPARRRSKTLCFGWPTDCATNYRAAATELVLKPTLPSERSGIVSFRHPRMVPAELHTRLREAGVIISLRGDFLRASPHYYNSDEDLDRLLEALPQ